MKVLNTINITKSYKSFARRTILSHQEFDDDMLAEGRKILVKNMRFVYCELVSQ